MAFSLFKRCSERTALIPVDIPKPDTRPSYTFSLINPFLLPLPPNAPTADALSELLASVERFGILTPLAVCRQKGEYRILSGVRRAAAARLLGFKTVPCMVLSADAATADAIAHELQEPAFTGAALRAEACQNVLDANRSDLASPAAFRLMSADKTSYLPFQQSERRSSPPPVSQSLKSQESKSKAATLEPHIKCAFRDSGFLLNSLQRIVTHARAMGLSANLSQEPQKQALTLTLTLPDTDTFHHA